ncbi:MAG: type II toxin-antitoxin system VapC family toxin [Gemmatimonadaceae bacterium]
MILVDTHIIMYAAGAPHPNKEPSARLLEQIARGEIEAAIDAEALQEILHRYRAINRWNDEKKVYDLARQIFPVVIPVTAEVTDQARQFLDYHKGMMARDALHAAVVITEGLGGIYPYDADFEGISGVRRLEPGD